MHRSLVLVGRFQDRINVFLVHNLHCHSLGLSLGVEEKFHSWVHPGRGVLYEFAF